MKYLYLGVGVAGGFALGLYVAKKAYEAKVKAGIGDVLPDALKGGWFEDTIDKLVLG